MAIYDIAANALYQEYVIHYYNYTHMVCIEIIKSLYIIITVRYISLKYFITYLRPWVLTQCNSENCTLHIHK